MAKTKNSKREKALREVVKQLYYATLRLYSVIGDRQTMDTVRACTAYERTFRKSR